MADRSLSARRKIVETLRADAALTALVPAERIYGPSPPSNAEWPFVRYGAATVLPDRASCMNGSRIVVSVHAFAKGASEDEACTIAAAITQALDGAELVTEDGEQMTVTWTGGQTLRDTEEASAWHCPVDFELSIVSA